jgi:two-component system NtrC family sensor kinase
MAMPPDTNSSTAQFKRILVVDDGPELPKALRLMLTVSGGYKIDIAAEGDSALSTFEAGKYDVVITDYKMPWMNGLQLAVAIKERSPRQPIILTTAYTESLADQDWQSKVDFLLQKPFSLDELHGALAKVLDKSRTR